jgi:hypothetical protein
MSNGYPETVLVTIGSNCTKGIFKRVPVPDVPQISSHENRRRWEVGPFRYEHTGMYHTTYSYCTGTIVHMDSKHEDEALTCLRTSTKGCMQREVE